MPVRPKARLLLALALVAIPGCASARVGGSADVASGGPELITQAELRAAPSGTAYTMVQALRPQWLRSRGMAISAGQLNDEVVGGRILPVVYLDGTQWGDVRALDAIDSDSLERIEFMSAIDATTRYGTGHSGGVIHVRTQRP